jgi:hypothetical protein
VIEIVITRANMDRTLMSAISKLSQGRKSSIGKWLDGGAAAFALVASVFWFLSGLRPCN